MCSLHTETLVKVNNEKKPITLGHLYFLGLEEERKLFTGKEWVKILEIKPIYDIADYLEVTLDTGDVIKCTFEHKFFVENKVKEGQNLHIGDRIANLKVQDTKVIAINIVYNENSLSLFYDIKLDNDQHNFILANGVVVGV